MAQRAREGLIERERERERERHNPSAEERQEGFSFAGHADISFRDSFPAESFFHRYGRYLEGRNQKALIISRLHELPVFPPRNRKSC